MSLKYQTNLFTEARISILHFSCRNKTCDHRSPVYTDLYCLCSMANLLCIRSKFRSTRVLFKYISWILKLEIKLVYGCLGVRTASEGCHFKRFNYHFRVCGLYFRQEFYSNLSPDLVSLARLRLSGLKSWVYFRVILLERSCKIF